MRISSLIIFGMCAGLFSAARADTPVGSDRDLARQSAHLDKGEKKLEQMHTERDKESSSADTSKENFRKGNVEMDGHKKQLSNDVDHLKSVESQIAAGQSEADMVPLQKSRKSLKKDIQAGGRQIHNDKTVLGVEKRTIDSNARYLAIEDRGIQKQEDKVADERSKQENITGR